MGRPSGTKNNMKTPEEKLEKIEMYESILAGLSNAEEGKTINGPKALKELREKYSVNK